MSAEADLFEQALAHHREGRLGQAAALYQETLKGSPARVDALYLLGVIAHQTGAAAEAAAWMRRALTVEPRQARCLHILGVNLTALGQTEEAEASLRQALALEPSTEAYNDLGILLKAAGRLEEAMAAYGQAVALDPGNSGAHYNLGNTYRAQGRLEAAAECFGRALESDPGGAHAAAALGQVLHALGRPADAAPLLESALALRPDDAGLHCDLGDALQSLGQWAAAMAQYRDALRLDARRARAWYSGGCAESARKEYVAAAEWFRGALALRADWPEAQHNLGEALFHLGQVEEALGWFRRAAAGDAPALPLAAIAVAIPGDAASDNQAILEARTEWARRQLPVIRTAAGWPRGARRSGPLRVGYVSSFFADHNWMKPVWGLINHHDRRGFEIHLFSDGEAGRVQHGYRAHPQDRFHDTSALSNDALADAIATLQIDLLVDLNGYSTLRRLPLMGAHPAAVTAGWFNLYATSGMASYDYLIGDDTVIPPEEERFYCERIVRVPGSYLTFEVTYPAPEVAPAPCLAKGAVTFGCLASQYKVTPATIALWSAILRQVPGSTLLLKNRALASADTRAFVAGQFAGHGVAAERLRLEGPADHYAFLEAYGEIDLALDTFPYNGGTTTTEALWQGVPPATWWGDRWVARTSASLLRAGGWGELVGGSAAEFVALAVRLAEQPGRLAEMRRQMRPRLRTSAACDTESFARHMERLYRQMTGL